jgi:hypothetical protein
MKIFCDFVPKRELRIASCDVRLEGSGALASSKKRAAVRIFQGSTY